MALLSAEGLDDVATGAGAPLGKPRWAATNAGWTIEGAAEGWGGGQCYSHDVDDQSISIDISDSSDTTTITQFAYRLTHNNNGAPDAVDVSFRMISSSGDSSKRLMSMRTVLGGTLFVFEASDGAASAEPVGILTDWWKDNYWHYFQIKHVAHASAGSIEIWIDGIQKLALTNLDTIGSSGETSVDRVQFLVPDFDNGNEYSYDDIIVMDGTGGVMDDLVDPVYIEQLLATADGNDNSWTPLGGVNNFDQVDDPFSSDYDGDSTYLSSSTVDQDDFVNVADMAPDYTVGTIHYAMNRSVLKYVTSGDARQVIYNNAQEVATADLGVTTSYVMYDQIAYIDPDGGAAWTEADINAAQVGVRYRT